MTNRDRNVKFNGAQRHRAFTLVEVMVAMAIFVFGALAILKIFPSALGLVRDTEDQAAAIKLSRGTTSALEGRSVLPCEAMFKAGAINSWGEPEAGGLALPFVGGRLSFSLPMDADQFVNCNLSDLKRIRGERQTVRNSAGGLYTLTQFPYTGSVQVILEDWIDNARIRPDGSLDLSQAVLASNGNPLSSLTPANIIYYVTYKWLADPAGTGSDQVQGVVDEPLAVASPVNGQVTRSAKVIPGAVTMRVRQRLGAVTPAPGAVEPALGIVQLGAIAGLSTGKKISLDYDVADWRNMVFNTTPSAPALDNTNPFDRNITTPVTGIDPDQSLKMLFIRPNASPNPAQLDWADYSNGVATTSGPPTITDLNTTTGRITAQIPALFGTNYVNTPSRVIFRTLDGWAHQLAVAARSYVPYVENRAAVFPNSPREGWREYAWMPGPNPEGGKLFFQPSDAGMVVMVTYEFSNGTGPRRISSAMVPIGEELVDVATIPNFTTAYPGFAPNSRRVAVAQLTDMQGNPLGVGNVVSSVISVEGVSVLARTAWIKNRRYTQVVSKGMRPPLTPNIPLQ